MSSIKFYTIKEAQKNKIVPGKTLFTNTAYIKIKDDNFKQVSSLNDADFVIVDRPLLRNGLTDRAVDRLESSYNTYKKSKTPENLADFMRVYAKFLKGTNFDMEIEFSDDITLYLEGCGWRYNDKVAYDDVEAIKDGCFYILSKNGYNRVTCYSNAKECIDSILTGVTYSSFRKAKPDEDYAHFGSFLTIDKNTWHDSFTTERDFSLLDDKLNYIEFAKQNNLPYDKVTLPFSVNVKSYFNGEVQEVVPIINWHIDRTEFYKKVKKDIKKFHNNGWHPYYSKEEWKIEPEDTIVVCRSDPHVK